MKVKVGELNKRITVIKDIITKNENGYVEKTEQEVCNAWAKVSNISGTEIFKAGADYNKVKTRFLIRYRKDIEITAKMKVKYGKKIVDKIEKDKYYNIIYVNNYNYSNKFIELVTEVIE